METNRTITRQELSSLVRHPGVLLFEALSEPQWASGHLPGALAMPLERIAEVARTAAPDKSVPIVVYCASETCRNSDIAANKLASLGYASVRVYRGGKADWKSAGLALEVAP